jgi:hypothetical protein
MKTRVTKYMFTDVMTLKGFSYNGAMALFDFLEYMYDDLEFDPKSLASDWTEYKDLAEVAHDYGEEYGDLDYLYQSTMVIEFDKGIIVLNF